MRRTSRYDGVSPTEDLGSPRALGLWGREWGLEVEKQGGRVVSGCGCVALDCNGCVLHITWSGVGYSLDCYDN